MAKRRKISQEIQDAVLIQSRRRCCICFGLNRDTSLKSGQIAHLDHDNQNDSPDNLAFLCFDHHDEYDSQTRQRKNFTIKEVKNYRSELLTSLDQAFRKQVAFGEATTDANNAVNDSADTVIGHYIRVEGNSADILVSRLLDGRYHISGCALWGEGREYGPNMGFLDFVGDMKEDCIEYKYWADYSDEPGPHYRADFLFSENELQINEQPFSIGMFGMNVSFKGTYKKSEPSPEGYPRLVVE